MDMGMMLLLLLIAGGAAGLSKECRCWIASLADLLSKNLCTFAKRNDLGRIRQLLAAGADCNRRNRFGLTPLHIAASRGHREIAEVLLDAGALVDTPVTICSGNGAALQIVHEVGEKHQAMAQLGCAPLHFAITGRSVEIVVLLLRHHADPNLKRIFANGQDAPQEISKTTPLHLAADLGQAEIIRHLLAAGGDREAMDDDSLTPLQIAARKEHAECVTVLQSALDAPRAPDRPISPAEKGRGVPFPPANSFEKFQSAEFPEDEWDASCSDCNGKVSVDALTCPHCGADLSETVA